MRATPWYPVAPCHVPVRVRLKASQEKRKERAAQVIFYACSMRPDFPLYYCKRDEGHQPGGHPNAPHIAKEKRHQTTLARSKNETVAPPYRIWGQAPVARVAVGLDMCCECTDSLYWVHTCTIYAIRFDSLFVLNFSAQTGRGSPPLAILLLEYPHSDWRSSCSFEVTLSKLSYENSTLQCRFATPEMKTVTL